MAQLRPKMAQRRPKMVQLKPKEAQREPTEAQRGPKMAQLGGVGSVGWGANGVRMEFTWDAMQPHPPIEGSGAQGPRNPGTWGSEAR